jgi:hypothetical protein
VTGLLNLLGLSAFLALASAGWPGAPSRCLEDIICYCEVTQPGLVRQPFNSWSNLACVPVSLLIAFDAERLRRRTPADFLPRLGFVFALATCCQGLMSLFFHASLTTWGAVLDALSIFFVAGLLLAVNLLRLGVLAPNRLLPALAACIAFALAYRLLVVPVMAPLVLLIAFAVFLTERRAQLREARAGPRPWFRVAFTLFLVGAAVWVLSLRSGFPLCSRWFPWGHALWHVLAALLTGAFWLHARDAVRLDPAASAIGSRRAL